MALIPSLMARMIWMDLISRLRMASMRWRKLFSHPNNLDEPHGLENFLGETHPLVGDLVHQGSPLEEGSNRPSPGWALIVAEALFRAGHCRTG